MKPKFLRVTFLLTAVEGLIAGSLLLATPSEPESARFLGYSALRLLLAGATFFVSLVITAFSISNKFSQFSIWLNNWLTIKDRLVHTMLLLVFSILLLLGAFLFTWLFVPVQLRGIILWLLLAACQLFILMRISYGVPGRPVWWHEAAMPKLINLSHEQKRVFTALVVFGVIYFALFIPPNLQGADTPHEFSLYGGDEKIIYPILTQMFNPGETFSQTLYHLFIYEDYHYGYPFYLLSALTLLPSRLVFGAGFAQHTQLNMLLLRQIISVLPMILSAFVLTYLMTRFRKLWISLGLFVLLLLLPGVVGYNIRFWHPDSLAVLMVALTLYFLVRDRVRLGPNFYYAAVCSGLATSLRLVGFFFFLAVGAYLVYAWLWRKEKIRTIIVSGVAFVVVMLLVIVLSSPYVFDSGARARFGDILDEKMVEMRSGYDEPDPEGVYSPGLNAWLPFFKQSFGSAIFLAFVMVSLFAGILWGKERTANLLILAWFLPAAGYLVAFLAVKSAQYLLPPFLPVVSTAFNFLLITAEGLPKKNWQRAALRIVALGIILFQLILFIRTDVSIWLDGIWTN